jgi:hypothetical protein
LKISSRVKVGGALGDTTTQLHQTGPLMDEKLGAMIANRTPPDKLKVLTLPFFSPSCCAIATSGRGY